MSDDVEAGTLPPTPGTGHPDVDRVLADVDRLHEQPLDEHAAAFAAAHERLRRALDVTDRRD